jgi:hypothetical protein
LSYVSNVPLYCVGIDPAVDADRPRTGLRRGDDERALAHRPDVEQRRGLTRGGAVRVVQSQVDQLDLVAPLDLRVDRIDPRADRERVAI